MCALSKEVYYRMKKRHSQATLLNINYPLSAGCIKSSLELVNLMPHMTPQISVLSIGVHKAYPYCRQVLFVELPKVFDQVVQQFFAYPTVCFRQQSFGKLCHREMVLKKTNEM